MSLISRSTFSFESKLKEVRDHIYAFKEAATHHRIKGDSYMMAQDQACLAALEGLADLVRVSLEEQQR